MTTLPALPSQEPITPEENAIACLTSSTGNKLSVQQTREGEWIVAPASGCTAHDVRLGLTALSEEMAGGPKHAISDAIAELIGATDRPPQLGDEAAVARVLALKQMAWDYPIDVVQIACRQWRRVPKQGRWWPAEQDLRAICDALVKPRKDLHDSTKRLLREMESQETRGRRERSGNPRGKTAEFVAAVEKVRGRDFVKSWLSALVCDFTDDCIFTIGLGVDRLTAECSGLLVKHGVTVRQCNDVRDRFYHAVDNDPQLSPAKKKKGAWGQ